MDRRFFQALGASLLDRTICSSAGAHGYKASPGNHGSVLTLRSERRGGGSRSLWLRLEENGDVAIEGPDLGPSVVQACGGSEYEWTVTIKAAE